MTLELILYTVYGLLTVITVWMVVKLMYAFKHFRIKHMVSGPAMIKDLPSVSVCIPARNETHAMTQCLERVIASTYPKLEIIVLDDSSGDNTSILIKSFAHAGVRFVEGSPLPDGWLGKNHALEGLFREASGSLVLYMDVDTHVQPDTIEQLVAYMMSEKADMVSVMPRRRDVWRISVFFGTLRYLWELLLHRRLAPAVASSAWMVRRATLTGMGGFTSMQTHVQPEATLAARLMTHNSYRFLISTPMIGVSYEKKWQSQIDTSIRLLFPVLGGRVFLAFVAVAGLFLLTLPILMIIAGLFTGWTLTQSMALWHVMIGMALYGLYLEKLWDKGWWLGALLWPIVVAQECVLVIISTWRYLRGTVTWKNRPVTVTRRQVRLSK
jgi:glycosyltransferase involved in cell wall biosynthesis